MTSHKPSPPSPAPSAPIAASPASCKSVLTSPDSHVVRTTRAPTSHSVTNRLWRISSALTAAPSRAKKSRRRPPQPPLLLWRTTFREAMPRLGAPIRGRMQSKQNCVCASVRKALEAQRVSVSPVITLTGPSNPDDNNSESFFQYFHVLNVCLPAERRFWTSDFGLCTPLSSHFGHAASPHPAPT